MTRPIYEPSELRTLASQGYADRQLLRRPAPTMSGSLAYCWMRWVGSEAIAANALSNPATIGTPDVPYEESFIYDPTNIASFTPDRDTGCIQWGLPGEYLVHATVEWNGTGSIGETLGAVLDLGEECTFSTVRVINSQTADSTNQNAQIPVSTVMFDFNSDRDSVRVLVYHTDAGGNDVGAVWIHVIQLSAAVDGEFDPP